MEESCDLACVLGADKVLQNEVIQRIKYALYMKGWCYVKLPAALQAAVRDTTILMEQFFLSDGHDKTLFSYERIVPLNNQYGYVNAGDREKFRLLTGNFTDELEFPSENFKNTLVNITKQFDSLTKAILKIGSESFFESSIETFCSDNSIPLLQEHIPGSKYHDFGMLDIVYYHENEGERVAEHGDPGVFSLSVGSTSEGLEVKNSDGNWIQVPNEQCILWAGSAATELSNGNIPACIHRVKGSNIPRLTIWYEICTIQQIPEDIWKQTKDTTISKIPLNKAISIHVKFLTGKTIEFECTSNTTVEQIKELIQQKIGIPPAKNRLVYAGRVVNDLHTLNDLQVPDGGIFHAVLALR